jgi:phosphate starvation-inducible PhoH-like protein
MVITGDITQVDLPSSRPSGLIEIQTVLEGIDGIRFVYFDHRDVVRHDLVSAIVRAYDRVKPARRTPPHPALSPGGGERDSSNLASPPRPPLEGEG